MKRTQRDREHPQPSPGANKPMGPPKTIPRPGCDVFLSHRGPEIKRSFVDFLYSGLSDVGVTAFVDEVSLKPGEANAWDIITENVRSARIKMPVLSCGYGDSCYCLEELRIMMADPGNDVMPIFYDDFDTLKDVLQKKVSSACRRGGKHYVKYEAKYHDALDKVFSITGWRLNQARGAAELARFVVSAVVEKVRPRTLHVASYPMDIDRRVEDIMFKLEMKRADAPGKAVMLGLWGMGGIGKTTLAKAIYNKLHSKFAGSSCFIEVGDNAGDARLVKLQQQMLKQLTGQDIRDSNSIAEGRDLLGKCLQDRKVLLVIDDIWRDTQSDALLGPLVKLEEASSPVLDSGSYVLVTSRNRRLLNVLGYDKHMVVVEEKVHPLDAEAATKLFCDLVFGSQLVPTTLATDINSIIQACQGLPLTLEVVGAYLRFNGTSAESLEYTLECLRTAETLDGTEDNKLWSKLRLSYDKLAKKEKVMFLDICCFAFGKSAFMVPAWGQFALITLKHLEDLSLVRCHDKIGRPAELTVHDQLRDMGRKIARDCKPRKHIWMPEALEALQQVSEQLTTVETVSLAGVSEGQKISGLPLMPRLRMLDLGGADWDGTICVSKGNLNSDELVFLKWHYPRRVPSSVLSRVFVACTNLVVLHIASAESNNFLEYRKVQLPESIEKLRLLQTLILTCEDIQELPRSMAKLRLLRTLNMSRCGHLAALPESFGELATLQTLDMSGCLGLAALPESFGELAALQTLRMSFCRDLAALPESFGKLAALQTLDMSGCWGLAALPESFGELAALQTLDMSHCGALAALPESFGKLAALQTLHMSGCWGLAALPESFGKLAALQTLRMLGCRKLAALPESFGKLAALQTLHMSLCYSLAALPESFGKLAALQTLDMSYCRDLAALPESFGKLAALQTLDMSHCGELAALPESFGELGALQKLAFSGCTSLLVAALPNSFSELAALGTFDVCDGGFLG